MSSNDQNSIKTKILKDENGILIEEIGDDMFRATSEKSSYIIEYDRSICIGAASCAAIAAMTFLMDDENKAVFRTDTDALDDDDIILAGAQSCPVFAIKVIEKSTGEVIFPVG